MHEEQRGARTRKDFMQMETLHSGLEIRAKPSAREGRMTRVEYE
jgi:hypothetical protein